MKRIILFFLLIGSATFMNADVVESKVDHSKWDKLLQQNVSSNGNVNYDGMKASMAQLDDYLKMLSSNLPTSSWSKNETMAYWINAYNAYTVKLILNNYPLKSIMDVNGGKAWDLKFIKMGGKEYSLNDIEHGILRKQYKDARIHFAVNCASISCPKLRNSAFTAVDLEKQLNEMARGFVNNSSKNNIQANAVKISSLFDWYKEDFTRNGDVIAYLNKYSKTKISPSTKISYLDYNWNLNK